MERLNKFGITIELLNSLGFKQNTTGGEERGYFEFESQWALGGYKHKIKGYNQRLSDGFRFINIFVQEDKDYFDIGIKCDGKTRYLFNGVCQNVEDFKTIIRLVD